MGASPCNSDCSPGTSRSGIKVVTHTRLEIEVSEAWYWTIIEHFLIAVGHDPVLDEALGLQPKTVQIGADPALAVPAKFVLLVRWCAPPVDRKADGRKLIVHHWRLSILRINGCSRARWLGCNDQTPRV